MTDKPNAVEGIMAMGSRKHRLGGRNARFDNDDPSWREALAEMRAILAALDAAGKVIMDEKDILAAAAQFEGYAKHHRAKGAIEKADINQSWCDLLLERCATWKPEEGR